MVAEDQLLRRAAESLADVHVEAALPITVAEGGRRRCDGQLAGHEVVVCNRISREMREVAEAERAQGLGFGVVVDLESDVPRVGVSARRGVFLGNAGVGRDRSVQEVVREGRQQLGDCLLYTSPSPRDRQKSRMPSSA